jgi:hypothetical protein
MREGRCEHTPTGQGTGFQPPGAALMHPGISRFMQPQASRFNGLTPGSMHLYAPGPSAYALGWVIDSTSASGTLTPPTSRIVAPSCVSMALTMPRKRVLVATTWPAAFLAVTAKE